MKKPRISRLSVKLIIVISVVLLVNLIIYTIVTVGQLKKEINSALVQNAYNMGDIVKKSARYSMLLNRGEDVLEIIKTVGNEQGVHKIRVYNKVGSIKYSSDTSEIGEQINTSSEACYVCHSSKTATPQKLPFEQMIRSYKAETGESVLGFINPIYNEQDCYTAPCHYHPRNKTVLGVLDIIISTEKIDAILDSTVRNIITGSMLITLLIALSSGVAITYTINAPLKKISKGMAELSKGNLAYTISVNSTDELGLMASQFNKMSTQLDGAYREIKDWNETLNMKVQEKNEELKKIYEQIVHIEKLASLGKLSATVAHELNNPLEGILTYSKLISKILAKRNHDGEYNRLITYLSLISDESARCGRIVKDLLLFSHTEEVRYARADLRDIIEKNILLVNHHLEMNNVLLSKILDKEPVYVHCDEAKIEQALLTVVMNGIEAMPNGGALKIIVTRDDRQAIVLIKDEGGGIDRKDLPNIFEPFFSTKTEAKGTGLGLSVCYGIITSHKGAITVEETSPKGTVFKIVLPLSTT